jgi:hypothetical protein
LATLATRNERSAPLQVPHNCALASPSLLPAQLFLKQKLDSFKHRTMGFKKAKNVPQRLKPSLGLHYGTAEPVPFVGVCG